MSDVAELPHGGPSIDGLCIVDKPAGCTSHDVVARVRRLAGTRRVGHAGTLDPMATGVLVLGVGRATKLLGHLAMTAKSYDATICLGRSTVSDDADGDVVANTPAGHVSDDRIRTVTAAYVGTIDQVPSAVSAIKVGGRRAYARVRAGEQVALAPRAVEITRLDVVAIRRDHAVVEVDVSLDCSTGTYVRAVARDLGTALGVGGHLTALRRTRVGRFTLADAATLDDLAARDSPVHLSLAAAVAACFPRRDVDAQGAGLLAHGRFLPPAGCGGTYGVFAPDGAVVALVQERDGVARPLVVFAPAP